MSEEKSHKSESCEKKRCRSRSRSRSCSPHGPAGPQGPRGYPGKSGSNGKNGKDGKDGADGAQGAQGPVGPQGEQGIVGPAGPQGRTGATGPEGTKGDTGPMGPLGLTGPTGPQGERGFAGPVGPRGPRGEEGKAGPQGPQGNTFIYFSSGKAGCKAERFFVGQGEQDECFTRVSLVIPADGVISDLSFSTRSDERKGATAELYLWEYKDGKIAPRCGCGSSGLTRTGLIAEIKSGNFTRVSPFIPVAVKAGDLISVFIDSKCNKGFHDGVTVTLAYAPTLLA